MSGREGMTELHTNHFCCFSLSQTCCEEVPSSLASRRSILTDLLRKYGKPGRPHPEYPFWRLQADGLWEIPQRDLLNPNSSGDVGRTDLLKRQITGGFPPQIDSALRTNRAFAGEVVQSVLSAHFPSSLHEDILADVGVSLPVAPQPRPRDPPFRRQVIQAYRHRCAICGYDGKLGPSDLAPRGRPHQVAPGKRARLSPKRAGSLFNPPQGLRFRVRSASRTSTQFLSQQTCTERLWWQIGFRDSTESG